MVEAVPELDGFHASNGWLESSKMSYGIRESTTTTAGEAGDAPITTVKAWMKRFPELKKGYLTGDILNMEYSKYGRTWANYQYTTTERPC